MQDRTKLRSFRVELTEAEYRELEERARASGLKTATRYVRWLLRLWGEVEAIGGLAPSWELDPTVELALVRQGKARVVKKVDPWQGEYVDKVSEAGVKVTDA